MSRGARLVDPQHSRIGKDHGADASGSNARLTENVLATAEDRINALDAMFSPKTIAVIGASEKKGSVGRAVMENLGAFSGAVFPVNPSHKTVLNRHAFPSITDVRDPIDLAVIVTPSETVPNIVEQCAGAGVRAAIVISAGFKECGARGCELEKEMAAKQGGMRILGPNCLGAMVPHVHFNATFAATSARPGSVAFLSQSGALCTAILDWSLRENVGFSAFVSLGSMLDVGWGDLIDYFGDDPHTKSIVCYMESIGDARKFLSAAREVSFTKPIIVIKVGHTEAAARAAASHTGSLTGSDEVLDAAFRRVGVLRVNTIEEMFDMAEVLGKQPRPRGPRLAVVTNAGGPGALATDMLVSCGGQLAKLGPDSIAALDRLLPAAWSHGNPIDALGAADAEIYYASTRIALSDAETDGVLVVLTPQAMTDSTGTAERIATLAKSAEKPLIASWMGGASLDPARAILNDAGVPTYDYPDAAARAFSLMWKYSDNLRLLYERPTLPTPTVDTLEDRLGADQLIRRVRAAKRTLLTEVESKEVLAAYGIRTVEAMTAMDEDEAVRCAAKIGYPVVLKLLSERVTHKTDVGGVLLDLHSSGAVRRGWRLIQQSVTEKAGAESFLGVTVQPMVRAHGIELILGSSVDRQVGPVLLFGAGGELVEILKDRALGLPPLTATLARRLMERTRIFQALMGVRGRKGVDLPALTQLLVAFSHLVAEQTWISEIDINPLLASAEGFIALDARVVLHPPDLPDSSIPQLAIRPYPVQYIRRITLRDGSEVVLRPIRPEDEDKLTEFHATLSEESVQFRYFGSIPLKTRIAHDRLVRICFSDYDREIAIVAEHTFENGKREIVGVGRINRMRKRNEAEFAIVISDSWQHRGLGRQLLDWLVTIGRAERLSCIRGTVLPGNNAMLSVCRAVGFQVRRDSESGDFAAEYPL